MTQLSGHVIWKARAPGQSSPPPDPQRLVLERPHGHVPCQVDSREQGAGGGEVLRRRYALGSRGHPLPCGPRRRTRRIARRAGGRCPIAEKHHDRAQGACEAASTKYDNAERQAGAAADFESQGHDHETVARQVRADVSQGAPATGGTKGSRAPRAHKGRTFQARNGTSGDGVA